MLERVILGSIELSLLNLKIKVFSVFCLSTFISVGFAGIGSAGVNDWERVDHEGHVSAVPAKRSAIPTWRGWTEQIQAGNIDGDRYYRRRKYADGSELRFYTDHPIEPICTDRYPITATLSEGKTLTGFADQTGRVVIVPKYVWAHPFYNGVAVVKERKGEPWMVVDKSGKIKRRLPRDMTPQISSHFWGVSKEGILAVRKGEVENSPARGVDGLYNLVSGQFYPLGARVIVDEFSEGLACFQSNDLYGYVDAHGKTLIAKQFEQASDFKDGWACVRRGKQRGFIDRSGKFVLRLPLGCMGASPFSEGVSAVAMRDSNGLPKIGFIDRTGKFVIPAAYYAQDDFKVFSDSPHPAPEVIRNRCRDDVTHFIWNMPKFREGVAHVAIGNEEHHQYGFIDKLGKWKIQPQFRDAQDFENKYAMVQTGREKFKKDDWKKKGGSYFGRGEIFDLFVKQYHLLGMSRIAVKEFLGKGDRRCIDSDVFDLQTGFCGNAYRGVEIFYSDDKVSKYRFLSFDSKDAWIVSIDGSKRK